MQIRRLGKTDIKTACLGFGAARLVKLETPSVGHMDVDGASQATADHLLNSLVDAGVNFIDTAASYLNNEEMIGNALSHRRNDYWLATKAPDTNRHCANPWSPKAVTLSIERSLKLLNTDYVDLLQLHGCSKKVLSDGHTIEALLKAKASGKARYIGYSGDGEHAQAAINTGVFDTLQTSFNLVDQAGLRDVIPSAKTKGMGVIAKRPIANGVLSCPASPYLYADDYWRRSRIIHLPPGFTDPNECALRFTLAINEIDIAILGTRRLDHALAAIRWASKGPLTPPLVANLRSQFLAHGHSWAQH